MSAQPETYHGAPCAHGHTLRYRSNRKCVTCSCVPARYLVPICSGEYEEYETLADARQAADYPGGEVWRAVLVKR